MFLARLGYDIGKSPFMARIGHVVGLKSKKNVQLELHENYMKVKT